MDDPVELQIKLPESGVSGRHPFKNLKAHDALLNYCLPRLRVAKQKRDSLIPRYNAIDKDVYAYLKLDKEDRARRSHQLDGEAPAPTAINIPLVFLHLDDALTYLVQVFSPESGMFSAVAPKDNQNEANAFVQLMNSHAAERSYFRQLVRFSFDALKYNIGGLTVKWDQTNGQKVVNGPANQPVLEPAIIWEGNSLESMDMYNTLMDPTVHPVDLNTKGEFVATVEPMTVFRIKRLAAAGKIFNVKELLEIFDSTETAFGPDKFYQPPPDITGDLVQALGEVASNYDWNAIMSNGMHQSGGVGNEIVHMYIHLNPMQFGLVPRARDADKRRDSLEIWRISIANGKWIVATEHIPNAHGRLPTAFTTPFEDNLGANQKSIAEILSPLQTFGSFLMNTHVEATRKNIWDFIIYNRAAIPLDEIPEGEAAARVPLNPAYEGRNINELIWQNSNILDTKETMQQLQMVIELFQLLFPTQANPREIAGLDRPVTQQVSVVAQGSTRRMQKMAKMIDEQAFRPMRFMMYWNIMEFQQKITLIDQQTGESIEVDPARFRDSDIRLTIGAGLKTLDRASILSELDSLVGRIVQSPEAATQFDVPGLLNAMAQLKDLRIDLTQFRKQASEATGGAIPEADPNAPPVLAQ